MLRAIEISKKLYIQHNLIINMKYAIGLLFILTIFIAGCTAPSQVNDNNYITDTGAKVTGDLVVTIKDNAFTPKEITVPKGSTVIWKNDDARPHTVYIESLSKGSPAINPGKSYSYQFTDSGRFQYHCSFHPSMVAVVNVQ